MNLLVAYLVKMKTKMKYGDKIRIVNSPTLKGKEGFFVSQRNSKYIVVNINGIEMLFNKEFVQFI